MLFLKCVCVCVCIELVCMGLALPTVCVSIVSCLVLYSVCRNASLRILSSCVMIISVRQNGGEGKGRGRQRACARVDKGAVFLSKL